MPRAKPLTQTQLAARAVEAKAAQLDHAQSSALERLEGPASAARSPVARELFRSSVNEALGRHAGRALILKQERPTHLAAALKAGWAAVDDLEKWFDALPQALQQESNLRPTLDELADKLLLVVDRYETGGRDGRRVRDAAALWSRAFDELAASAQGFAPALAQDERRLRRWVHAALSAAGFRPPSPKKNPTRLSGRRSVTAPRRDVEMSDTPI